MSRRTVSVFAAFAIGIGLVAACVGDDPESGPGSSGSSSGGSSGTTTDGSSGSSSGNTGPRHALTVALAGDAGTGTVTSNPDGIDCGGKCSAEFPAGSSVTLTATPATGNAFFGWSGAAGACAANAACPVTMDGPKQAAALFGANKSAAWATTIGGANHEEATRVVMDKDGNLVVAFDFSAAFDFRGKTYATNGFADIFVAKLTPTGEVLWAKALGGAANDHLGALAVDKKTGDIAIAGTSESPALDLGGGAVSIASGNRGVWTVRYTGAGAHVWQKVNIADGSNDPTVGGVGFDPSGNVWLTGTFAESIDFGNGTLSEPGDESMFVAKLGATNGVANVKVKVAGPTAGAMPSGLVVDSAGNAIITGEFSGPADFDGAGPAPVMNPTGLDVFVVKLAAASAAVLWQKQIGGAGNDRTGGLTMIGGVADAVAVVMTFAAQTGVQEEFAGTPIGTSLTTTNDIAVGRFSSAGVVEWARRYPGNGDERGTAITALSDDSLAIAGLFTTNFSMDTQPLVFAGTVTDSLFAVLDGATNPTVTWAFKVGGVAYDEALSVAGRGKVLFGVGRLEGAGSFLGRTVDNAGGTDAYLFGAAVP